jgi:methionyl-tRNA synthetase
MTVAVEAAAAMTVTAKLDGQEEIDMSAEDPGREGVPEPEAKPQVPPAYNPEDELISIEEFMRVKLRVAEVLEARPHPNADKLLVLRVRVGEREKQLCAGIRAHYPPEDLVGKRIVVVDNLKPAKLRGEESQGMLLAATDGDNLVLVTTERPDVSSGSEIR